MSKQLTHRIALQRELQRERDTCAELRAQLAKQATLLVQAQDEARAAKRALDNHFSAVNQENDYLKAEKKEFLGSIERLKRNLDIERNNNAATTIPRDAVAKFLAEVVSVMRPTTWPA